MALKTREIVQLAVRSLMLQVLLNYRTLQGGGYLFALWPWLNKTRPIPERVEACANYCNAHPVFAALVIGALRKRVEEGAAEGDAENFPRWQESLCGPLGMMGDSLIWDRWKPILFSLAALILLLWPDPSVWCGVAVGALLVYNLPLFALRLWGVREGYRLGENVLQALSHSGFYKIRNGLTITGAALAGLLLAAAFLRTESPSLANFGALLSAFAVAFIGNRRQWPITSTLLVALAAAMAAKALLL